MKWFDRWFQKKVLQSMIEKDRDVELVAKSGYNLSKSLNASVHSDSVDSEKAIRFTVSKATGGIVVETNFYDRQRDRCQYGLYVVRDDQDLGKELGKIITMESLKQ